LSTSRTWPPLAASLLFNRAIQPIFPIGSRGIGHPTRGNQPGPLHSAFLIGAILVVKGASAQGRAASKARSNSGRPTRHRDRSPFEGHGSVRFQGRFALANNPISKCRLSAAVVEPADIPRLVAARRDRGQFPAMSRCIGDTFAQSARPAPRICRSLTEPTPDGFRQCREPPICRRRLGRTHEDVTEAPSSVASQHWPKGRRTSMGFSWKACAEQQFGLAFDVRTSRPRRFFQTGNIFSLLDLSPEKFSSDPLAVGRSCASASYGPIRHPQTRQVL